MLPDNSFFRTDVPMTKQEIRAISLAKLELQPHHRVLDVGAGTGSVTVEMALRCREVVAVEKDPAAVATLKENLRRFGLSHVQVVEGSAPAVLADLGEFDRVFIGGSGEELPHLLEVLPRLCTGRVVANAICIETVAQVSERFKHSPFSECELCEVQVSRSAPAGGKTRMVPLSPTWIMSASLTVQPAVGAREGCVVGLGVGPGDPDLLTLKAVKTLAGAQLVITPKSRDDAQSVALGIARRFVSPSTVVEEMTFPMSEDRSVTEAAWKSAAERLVACAREGKNAVFLTLGDSTLYSTWGYVQRFVRSVDPRVKLETVPGITSLSACAARVGVPLAEGRAPLLIWPDRIPEAMPLSDAHMVIMKAGKNLKEIGNRLAEWRRDGVAVTNCGRENEKIQRNRESFEDDSGYFTTVLVAPDKR